MHTIRTQPLGIAWVAAALLALVPFLLVTVPPLTDAPGHLGRMAVQAAAQNSPLLRDFGFHWALRLNLGTDLLVELLRHALGLVRAFWLVAALLPLLVVLAIGSLARATTGAGAAAASWALPFAYGYPLNYGFLNYVLAMALSLLGLALWLRLADRPRLREMLFWPLLPALLVVHAAGGGLLPVMIAAVTIGRPADQGERRWKRMPAIARELRPFLGMVPVVLLAGGAGSQAGAPFSYSIGTKFNAIALALRDQSRLLDIASMAGMFAILLAGQLLGARYRPAHRPVVLALLLLFLLAPNQVGGASFVDVRLLPPLAITALVLQDWSGVDRRWARMVTVAGFALFAVRMGVTTMGFRAYARSYAAEAEALPHIPRGARVLALVARSCRASRGWRGDRLDHFPTLATAEREAWVNAHWDVPGQQLLTVRFRPSPAFYDDPSHYAWPVACTVGRPRPRNAADERQRRRTLAEVLPALPLDRVDGLWLIGLRLPPGPWTARLTPVWTNGRSSLYAVRASR